MKFCRLWEENHLQLSQNYVYRIFTKVSWKLFRWKNLYWTKFFGTLAKSVSRPWSRSCRKVCWNSVLRSIESFSKLFGWETRTLISNFQAMLSKVDSNCREKQLIGISSKRGQKIETSKPCAKNSRPGCKSVPYMSRETFWEVILQKLTIVNLADNEWN